MAKTDFKPKAQDVMERALEVPAQDLISYLRCYGNVLPGLSKGQYQILTSDEVNRLPEIEALECRRALVMARMDAMKAQSKTA